MTEVDRSGKRAKRLVVRVDLRENDMEEVSCVLFALI